jgi:hypothetical protein
VLGNGLFETRMGTTWKRAAGLFGQLHIETLGYASASDHMILYAATCGGVEPATSSAAAETRRGLLAAASRVVDAGVYRYVVAKSRMTLALRGLTTKGTIKLGKRVTAKGLATPRVLAGGKVKLQVQRWARRWVTVKTVLRTIGSSGAYSWSYKPAKKGSYRVWSTLAKTATHMAAKTTWHTFKVK